MNIRWLGVAGLYIQANDDRGDIIIDPFVSGSYTHYLNSRESESVQHRVVDRNLFNDVRALVATHGHWDHDRDVPYIWSKWAGCRRSNRDVVVVGAQCCVKDWNTGHHWENQVCTWSERDDGFAAFTRSIVTVHKQGQGMLTRLKAPTDPRLLHRVGAKLTSQKFCLGGLELTFIRQFHSSVCLTDADDEATHEGTYAIYIEDKTAARGHARVENRGVSCQSAYLIFTAGLPYFARNNGDIMDGDYSEYRAPAKFERFARNSEWVFASLKQGSQRKARGVFEQTLRTFYCHRDQPEEDSAVMGFTPLHWDKHMGVTPDKVGKQGLRRQRRVEAMAEFFQQHAKPTDRGLRFTVLPNINFGIDPCDYSAQDEMDKKTWVGPKTHSS